MSIQPIRLPTALAALGLSILWGGNVVAIKLGLEAFPPFWSAFWRFFISVGAVSLWAYWSGLSLLPQKIEIKPLSILGCLFTVQVALLNLGVNWTSPAYGIVLLNTNPIFANILAHFVVPEDRLSTQRVIGLVSAFGGICVVFLGDPTPTLAEHPITGNFLLLLSSLLLGARLVYTNRLVQSIEPVHTVFWQTVFSLPIFLLCGWLFESPAFNHLPSVKALLAIFYQGVIVAGFCFVGWTKLLKRHSPGTLSMFSFASPLFGILFSSLFFGEQIASLLWIGLVGVTLGIFLVTRNSFLLSAPKKKPVGKVQQ